MKNLIEFKLADTYSVFMENEIALEFGIKFKANAGARFASAGREATFKIMLTWIKHW
jgi:nuclear transport factor 2 (NTF2) superfamily protein